MTFVSSGNLNNIDISERVIATCNMPPSRLHHFRFTTHLERLKSQHSKVYSGKKTVTVFLEHQFNYSIDVVKITQNVINLLTN